MAAPVFRFAPSPNGHLHLGHARSALLNFELAQQSGGRFLLRIEDIDASRCRPEYETAIYEDLAWLGLAWETPVRRQSEHLEDYARALEKLERMGVLYPAPESRGDIADAVAELEARHGSWPRDPDGAPVYPAAYFRERRGASTLAHSGAGATAQVPRLDMHSALAKVGPLTWTEEGVGPESETGRIKARPEAWGDVLLARKDVRTSYHLSVVVDDALQGVTHVVRGADLFWATSVHRLLQELLELPEPRYRHHRVITDEAGRKLAKSTNATALRALRAQGVSPAAIRDWLHAVGEGDAAIGRKSFLAVPSAS